MSTESLTLTIPRAAVGDLPEVSNELNERMHELLERNADGSLTPAERSQLETLVQMAQFAQVLAMAAQGAGQN